MIVEENEPLSIPGIRVGTAEATIKKPGRADLVLFELAEGTRTAAVFTRNAFAAAPVIVAREHLDAAAPRALLINSGNANAGTGARGLEDARSCCQAAAEALSVAATPHALPIDSGNANAGGLEDARSCCQDAAALAVPGEAVLPFSTGVIGEPLPVERIREAVPRAAAGLREDGWSGAARAIMTTDTVPKTAGRRIEVDGATVTLTGIAKGSGMIRPDMATMLAFIGTDAGVGAADLRAALAEAVAVSFNSITVDGDTSTNDACVACATGRGPALKPGGAGWDAFREALRDLCIELARAIVRDAEGATRCIELNVTGARDEDEARQVAFTVAHSPLVKTAAFAGDPNWGRILAAVGRSGLPDPDIAGVDIALDDVTIVQAGEPAPGYREADAAAVMARPEFTIRIALGRGDADARIWTSDLSYDYVKINAEYRT